MQVCANCGARLPDEVAACPACGWNSSSPAGRSLDTAVHNVAAGLSYVTFVIAIVVLLLPPYKKDRFARFHAFQAILLAAVYWLMMLSVFPDVLLGRVGGRLPREFGIIWLAYFVFWVYLMFCGFTRKRFKIPGLGDIAAKLAG